ncbi:Ca-activated chloride channel family protein [Filimonas zeae]|nr:VWA domain-containing protein [Filimonas zeae]MDR6337235.1 Ca-activated chloride channel family protein [Filimonas zeae]
MKHVSLFLMWIITAMAAFSQAVVVRGKVKDESGKPVQGASVNADNRAVVTDSLGRFSIQIASEDAKLVVTMIGFEEQEVKATGKKELNIVLHQDKGALNEVVVIGYATARKKDVSSMLQGRVAGLAVTNSTYYKQSSPSPGAPGAIWGERSRLSTDGEGYNHIAENRFQKVTDHPLSTFSIDVDAASYSNVRRIITDGNRPPAGAVRIEEMINYFSYPYKKPQGKDPVHIQAELSACPWNTQHQLALVALKATEIPTDRLPAANLVFLIDVSGSMLADNKLPLVKSSLHLLTENLRPQDKVAIVTYAGSAGLSLPATSGAEKLTIRKAIDRLEAGGSTAGGAGIQLAYKVAQKQLIKGGNNRVILCTDGDFNVGVSSEDGLVRLVEEKRESGVFLTVLGFGEGNYQDAKMQQLADKGNGNHAYIDGIMEARKVLVNEFGGTLFTVAKDVKLQIEFNPDRVKGYRLIGYENRLLAKEDFNNDQKDAGEMGSGHTVTALYEIIPAGVEAPELDSVDKLRYQKVPERKATAKAGGAEEVFYVKLRYKKPDEKESRLMEQGVKETAASFENASESLRFAAAVAAFGMKLRDSEFQGKLSYNDIIRIAQKATGEDKEKYRAEFVQLVKAASGIGDKQPIAVVEDGE